MKVLRNLARKCVHHLGNILRFGKVTYLRASGVTIGKNTMISLGAKIDVRRGKIVIGDNCHITHGCVILSHDGAARQINPDSDGEGSVTIGENVFIGVNTVVLPNITIGSNSVVGAGSVVVKDIPSNVVAAGNPAKILQPITSSNN